MNIKSNEKIIYNNKNRGDFNCKYIYLKWKNVYVVI